MDSTDRVQALRDAIDALPAGTRRRFRKRLAGAIRQGDSTRLPRLLDAIAADLARLAADAAPPGSDIHHPGSDDPPATTPIRTPDLTITYPADLPVSARRDDLMATIAAHQVVIVAGETGSGKSTQLPKLCLDLGRGRTGLIGHTQPRRIAARSIAERVASELGTEVGGVIGYTVRFNDEVGPDTMVRLMTDGILLAEIPRDPSLSRYDTIIVDEAHERSLNIDFLLGYLRRLLPDRPDLKLIVTSATIDTERFSRHFGDAPIVTVSGRTHPVEIRYRPLLGPEDDPDDVPEQADAICAAVEELRAEIPGDILVFCSGEREIRDTADALRERSLPDTEILPLYARLSAAEQHRVFAAHTGRRIVVATNVAETSITVPGIRSVIDPGTARISRYSRRTKVQRLPIEEISQASANQRSGRCGRIGPGIAIRLYSEVDFAERPEFTEPEIQRTNLASVILSMASLRLGDVEAFPFVDPPDARSIRDGIALLEELGAVDTTVAAGPADPRWLTPLGRRLARLPVDPRLGRMLLAAADAGCLTEALIIVSGMSIQDPRERPAEHRKAADEFHERLGDESSDFLSYLRLWEHLRAERRAGSSSRFRRQCRKEFLHYLRVREWQDVHAQLRQVCDQLGLTRNRTAAEPEQIHRALLTGLLSRIGMRDRDTREYRGARNVRFAIAPGSVQFRGSPRWVMAGELVETNRMWGRVIAPIRPEWVEQSGAHLVARTHSDPWWDRTRGAAVTLESVSIFGLALVADRVVPYRRIDPAHARELFIRHALVEGDWDTHHRFVAANRDAVAEVEALEARIRRGDLLVGDEDLVAWFSERIPSSVATARDFDRWWKRIRGAQPDLLTLRVEDLIRDDAGTIDPSAYPTVWHVDDLALPITYEVDPTSHTDGLTIWLPVGALNRVDGSTFEWLVPGMRTELVTALVKTLPKPLRKRFVPVVETVEAIIDRVGPESGRLVDSVRTELSRLGSIVVPADALDPSRLPSHLRPHFEIVDDRGVAIADGTDLGALRALLDREVRNRLAATSDGIECTGATSWEFGELPRVVETREPGHVVRAYPALVDEGDTVGVALLPDRDEQTDAMWAGTRRLLLLNRPSVSKSLRAALSDEVKLALVTSPYPSVSEWYDDVLTAATDQVMLDADAPVWDGVGFDRLLAALRARLPRLVADLARASGAILGDLRRIQLAMAPMTNPAFAPAIADVREQIQRLVYPGFLTSIGMERLPDVRRYLWAIERRLDQLPDRVARDRELMARCRAFETELDRLVDSVPWSPDLEHLIWMLQELRVSSFAQSLGTKGTVSEKRIRDGLAALAD